MKKNEMMMDRRKRVLTPRKAGVLARDIDGELVGCYKVVTFVVRGCSYTIFAPGKPLCGLKCEATCFWQDYQLLFSSS